MPVTHQNECVKREFPELNHQRLPSEILEQQLKLPLQGPGSSGDNPQFSTDQLLLVVLNPMFPYHIYRNILRNMHWPIRIICLSYG